MGVPISRDRVSQTMVNSLAVVQQHYQQVTDEHFEQASMIVTGGSHPIKKATQQPDEMTREVSQIPKDPRNLRRKTGYCDISQKPSGRGRPRTAFKFT